MHASTLLPVLLLPLAACQTPAAVRDTAQQVSTLTTAYNDALGDYVAQSNATREADARTLALIERQTTLQARENRYDLDVLSKAKGASGTAALQLLAVAPPTSTDIRGILQSKTSERTE